MRQRTKTAKVPDSASPICLGTPPSQGSGILGTLRLGLKPRARGRAGKNRGRERPRGPRGGRRLGDRMPGSYRRFLTPPRTARWGAGPESSTQLQPVPRRPNRGPHCWILPCAVAAPNSSRRLHELNVLFCWDRLSPQTTNQNKSFSLKLFQVTYQKK